jgi:hypothetical protein
VNTIELRGNRHPTARLGPQHRAPTGTVAAPRTDRLGELRSIVPTG